MFGRGMRPKIAASPQKIERKLIEACDQVRRTGRPCSMFAMTGHEATIARQTIKGMDTTGLKITDMGLRLRIEKEESETTGGQE